MSKFTFWREKNNSELYGSCYTFFSTGYEGKWTLLLPVFEHFKVSLSDEWWFWVFVRDAGHSMRNWLYMIILVSDSVAEQDCEGCQVFDGFWRVWSGIESKVECLRSTTSFGLWCGWLLLSSRDKGYSIYVCLCSCSHYECWLGWDPYDLPPVPFFWWLWRNFIHLAASGSSRHLWSTIVHPLQGVPGWQSIIEKSDEFPLESPRRPSLQSILNGETVKPSGNSHSSWNLYTSPMFAGEIWPPKARAHWQWLHPR